MEKGKTKTPIKRKENIRASLDHIATEHQPRVFKKREKKRKPYSKGKGYPVIKVNGMLEPAGRYPVHAGMLSLICGSPTYYVNVPRYG